MQCVNCLPCHYRILERTLPLLANSLSHSSKTDIAVKWTSNRFKSVVLYLWMNTWFDFIPLYMNYPLSKLFWFFVSMVICEKTYLLPIYTQIEQYLYIKVKRSIIKLWTVLIIMVTLLIWKLWPENLISTQRLGNISWCFKRKCQVIVKKYK